MVAIIMPLGTILRCIEGCSENLLTYLEISNLFGKSNAKRCTQRFPKPPKITRSCCSAVELRLNHLFISGWAHNFSSSTRVSAFVLKG